MSQLARSLAQSGHLTPRFTAPGRPLPEAPRHADREAVAELARRHHDLAPVMSFVGDEIGQHVLDVEREITPRVGFRRRHVATVTVAQLQERRDAATALLQGCYEVSRRNGPLVHSHRESDPVLGSQGLHPPAARIVEMGGDAADRAGRDARNRRAPQGVRDTLDQKSRHAVVRPPSGE